MPGIPAPPVYAPYDTLQSCLNVARTRLNDAIASINGEILTNTQPFTATMTNSAWRKLQAFLCNLGYSKYKRKFWAYGMPKVGSHDPSVETWWNWTTFFNGTAYFVPPYAVLLPEDFIAPLKISERQTGTYQRFSPMRLAPDGLPEGPKQPWNRYFEWKNDAIYMPGSIFSMDLEVEYAAFDADFSVDTNGVLVFTNLNGTPVTVPMLRCQSAFANYLCAEMALGRDDIDGAGFVASAESDARLLMNNSDVKLKQRRPVQRRAYSHRGRSYNTINGY